MSASPADRFRANATGIVSTLVTGIWLAALFSGQDWWLAALLFGYVVVVPLTAMLFGDESDIEEWWDKEVKGLDPLDTGTADEEAAGEANDSDTRDALETLRDRYARGDLTDEQFERKLDRLLESESLEDVEDRRRREHREARRERETARDR